MKLITVFFTICLSLKSFSQCVDCGPGSKAASVKKETRSVAEIYIESIKDTYMPGVYDGVPEPKKLPDLEENRKTLLGIDSNHDGVRDDIEIYINRHFDQDYDREIYKKYFRRGSYFLKHAEKMTLEKIQNEINQFDQDLECFRYLGEFNYLKNVDEFRNRTFNLDKLIFDTEIRYRIYNEAIRKLRSSGSGVSTGAEAFKYCPKNIQRKYPMKKKVI